jgi:hypothetical protein
MSGRRFREDCSSVASSTYPSDGTSNKKFHQRSPQRTQLHHNPSDILGPILEKCGLSSQVYESRDRTRVGRSYDSTVSSSHNQQQMQQQHQHQQAIQELKGQHEYEMNNLLSHLEKELSAVGKTNSQKIAVLQDRLEKSQMAAINATEELNEIKVHGNEDLRRLKDELTSSIRRSSELERTLLVLQRENSRLEETNKALKRQHNAELESKDNRIAFLESELREARGCKDEAIMHKNDEIRSLKSKMTQSNQFYTVQQETLDIIRVEKGWDEASEITQDCDFAEPSTSYKQNNLSRYYYQQKMDARVEKPIGRYDSQASRYSSSKYTMQQNSDDVDDFACGQVVSMSFSSSSGGRQGRSPQPTSNNRERTRDGTKEPLSTRLERMYCS